MQGTKAPRHVGTKGGAERSRVRSGRNAFTLMEILIVIGIIVLVLALAVPAFNFITGSRSSNAAENIIAAMLGRARAYAINNNVDAGVLFFVEPTTGRSTMAIVTRGISSSTSTANPIPSVGAEDPYYNYRGWTVGAWAVNPGAAPVFGPTQYYQSNETIWPTADSQALTSAGYPTENTLLVRRFDASQNHQANTGNQPLSSVWTGAGTASSSNGGTSGAAGNGIIDFVPDSEFQALPPGVGVQLINDPKDSGTNGLNQDRYVRTGAIMFDPQGRVESVPLQFVRGSYALGQRLGPQPVPPAIPPGLTNDVPAAGVQFYTQLGLVLYDQQTFLTQTGSSEGDWVTQGLSSPVVQPPQNLAAEQAEEQWLDKNSTPLYLDRYNGAVLKGE